MSTFPNYILAKIIEALDCWTGMDLAVLRQVGDRPKPQLHLVMAVTFETQQWCQYPGCQRNRLTVI